MLHAATLHEPHVGTHGRQQFVDSDMSGPPPLLEESVALGVGASVMPSTTVMSSTTSARGAGPGPRHRPGRAGLGRSPRHGSREALAALADGREWRGPPALAVGAQGYHPTTTGVHTVR